MPSTITHAYFSMDIYDRLSNDKKKMLESYTDHLKTFAQGPDVFFFYNLLSFRRGKRVRKLGREMQHFNTQSFFINLITSIKNNNLYNNPEIVAFLYGLIAHYILDMTIHPYIVYKTGFYKRNDKTTRKYFGGHETMEAYLDAYFVQIRNKIKPKDFKSHKYCFDKVFISKKTENLIDEVFLKTFNISNMGHTYSTSIRQMRAFYKLFRNDKTGLKKKIYTLSQIFPFNVKMNSISYNINLNNNTYYLNLDKSSWHHPLDNNLIYNYSFIELYSIAISKAVSLINDTDKFFNEKKNIKYLKKLYPNLSYVTGLDCNLGKGKYFSF